MVLGQRFGRAVVVEGQPEMQSSFLSSKCHGLIICNTDNYIVVTFMKWRTNLFHIRVPTRTVIPYSEMCNVNGL